MCTRKTQDFVVHYIYIKLKKHKDQTDVSTQQKTPPTIKLFKTISAFIYVRDSTVGLPQTKLSDCSFCRPVSLVVS